MAAAVGQLVDDLMVETEDLVALVTPLSPAGWETPTPAPGWSIRDQVGHLAYFDEQVTLAATDPDAFARRRLDALADVDRFVDAAAQVARRRPVADLVPWLYEARRTMIEATGTGTAERRIPWFGPDMSTASALTARIMETWAHGQDIADALGAVRPATARLRHIAHLGVVTRDFGFMVHGQPVPTAPVRVELAAPDASTWSWGPPEASDLVQGDALDFCLLVTQRRHRLDTGVRATGPVAAAWLEVAQAFAGPAGPGRPRLGGTDG
jgi:uncharacterized protein (TIGR03084 family)